jgi:hypothetical protein
MPLSLMVSSTTLLPKLLVTWQHAGCISTIDA